MSRVSKETYVSCVKVLPCPPVSHAALTTTPTLITPHVRSILSSINDYTKQ
jgi:hypothetical protein